MKSRFKQNILNLSVKKAFKLKSDRRNTRVKEKYFDYSEM